MDNLKQLDQTYIASTYNRFPVELVSGKGSLVKDNEGKTYIDMGSGIAVVGLLACVRSHPRLFNQVVVRHIDGLSLSIRRRKSPVAVK